MTDSPDFLLLSPENPDINTNMPPEMTAKEISAVLDRIGMTKTRLGSEIGVSTETIRQWERSGCKGPAVVALKAYASGWRP